MQKKPTEGYSKFTLQPLNPETAALYKEYTRSQVRNISLYTSILFAFITAVNLAIGLEKHSF